MPNINVLNEIQIKQDNNTTTSYKVGTVNGYYNPTNGKFYKEYPYVNEIEGASNLVYVDLGGNKLYIYKNSSFVNVSGSGGGSADNIVFGYYKEADGKFYEDSSYTTEIVPNLKNLYINLTDETIFRYDATNSEYVEIGETGGHIIENSSGVDLTTRDTMKFTSPFTVIDNSTNEITEIGLQQMAASEMDDIVTPLPQSEIKAKGLNDLKDTNITNPTNGQVLKYNATSEKWENRTGSGGGSSDAGDVNYDNTTSGLTADNVQDAIDEINIGLSNKQDKLTNPLTQSDVVNNLSSTSTTTPLSANQGKILNDSLSNKASWDLNSPTNTILSSNINSTEEKTATPVHWDASIGFPYILIDGVKHYLIRKSDIVDNLSTNSSSKVLSAAQGYAMSRDLPWYGTCDTAASTIAKVATTNDSKFSLHTGAKVSIKFTYNNTVSAPTLSVDSTSAKSIKAYGTTAPTSWWQAGDVVTFTYDGTNWIMGATEGQISNLNSGKVSKSGDTMSGALNFANTTWNNVGDDVMIGDKDVAGALCIKGKNGETRIEYQAYDGNSSGQLIYKNDQYFQFTKPLKTNLTESIVLQTDTVTIACSPRSSASGGTKTYTKAGYTPVFCIVTADAWGWCVTIEQKWARSNGTANLQVFNVGNWTDSSFTVTMNIQVLWVKNS